LATVGIDFGTSNSAVAVLDGGQVRIATFPRPAELARISDTDTTADTQPTVLFFPEYDRAFHHGHDAVAHYLFTGLEGRFIQSMKTFLPAKSFSGTQIRGKTYDIEELVATFLVRLLKGAEAMLGVPVTRGEASIVLGRPARFALEPDADELANTRLRAAAARAGLTDFTMLIEPVAAALAYEAQLDHDEVVLVADLGGGTSDFTVMKVGPGQRGRPDRRASILASRGIPVAGDRFDGAIVRACLLEGLGEGSHYLALTERAPVPHWIFKRLLQWNHVSFLKSRKTLEFLKLVHQTSERRDAIGALIRLIEDDQGYLLFRAVERAKRTIAQHREARIDDEEHGLAVSATLTRPQFEEATRELVDQIHATALEALAAADVAPAGVDAVFMTGGTSLVPSVKQRFAETFGAERLRAGSTFTSVVDGLARSGGVSFF
jgi:hypothetical chaperone protein